MSRRGRAATDGGTRPACLRPLARPPTGHFAAWCHLSYCGLGPRGVRGYIYVGQWCDLYSAFDSRTVAYTWGSRWGHGDVAMRRCPVSQWFTLLRRVAPVSDDWGDSRPERCAARHGWGRATTPERDSHTQCWGYTHRTHQSKLAKRLYEADALLDRNALRRRSGNAVCTVTR